MSAVATGIVFSVVQPLCKYGRAGMLRSAWARSDGND
jgi:hypothetical protein